MVVEKLNYNDGFWRTINVPFVNLETQKFTEILRSLS